METRAREGRHGARGVVRALTVARVVEHEGARRGGRPRLLSSPRLAMRNVQSV